MAPESTGCTVAHTNKYSTLIKVRLHREHANVNDVFNFFAAGLKAALNRQKRQFSKKSSVSLEVLLLEELR